MYGAASIARRKAEAAAGRAVKATTATAAGAAAVVRRWRRGLGG